MRICYKIIYSTTKAILKIVLRGFDVNFNNCNYEAKNHWHFMNMRISEK